MVAVLQLTKKSSSGAMSARFLDTADNKIIARARQKRSASNLMSFMVVWN